MKMMLCIFSMIFLLSSEAYAVEKNSDFREVEIAGLVMINGEYSPFPIYVMAISSDEEEWLTETESNTDGYYVDFNFDLPPGQYYFLAFSNNTIPEYHDGVQNWNVSLPITIEEDFNDMITFDLQMIDAGTGMLSVTGYVTEGNGNPLEMTVVVLYDNEAEIVSASITDSTGYYSLENINEGEYTILASRMFYSSVSYNISVSADEILNFFLNESTGITEETKNASKRITVKCYPNPFLLSEKKSKGISMLYKAIDEEPVKIELYNLRGQIVKSYSLIQDNQGNIIWDLKDSQGVKVSSGIFLYRVFNSNAQVSGKIVIIK